MGEKGMIDMYASIELHKDVSVSVEPRKYSSYLCLKVTTSDQFAPETIYIYGTNDQLREIAQSILSQLPVAKQPEQNNDSSPVLLKAG